MYKLLVIIKPTESAFFAKEILFPIMDPITVNQNGLVL